MIFKTFIAALAVSSMAIPAAAQESPIELSSQIQLVKTSDEGETYVSPDSVVPGDTLEFQTSYRNQTGETVTDFVVASPVPSSVTITARSVSALDVSVDGGTEWGSLADLTVVEEAGTRSATADDVTNVRWVIAEMAPDAEGTVQYRAIVK